jgi:AcrR family transcriptional regulator
MPREQREQMILDVAGQVFARDGYHAASMDDISRSAGVSKPMLYAYFASKEGLYFAYIERAAQELVERLQSALAEEDPATVRPRSRVDAFLIFVEEHRHGWRVLFGEATASRPLAEEVAVLRGRIVSAVRRLVLTGFGQEPCAHPAAADAAAHAIVGAGESLANWWLEHPDIPRADVAEWYSGIVRASVDAVCRD